MLCTGTWMSVSRSIFAYIKLCRLQSEHACMQCAHGFWHSYESTNPAIVLFRLGCNGKLRHSYRCNSCHQHFLGSKIVKRKIRDRSITRMRNTRKKKYKNMDYICLTQTNLHRLMDQLWVVVFVSFTSAVRRATCAIHLHSTNESVCARLETSDKNDRQPTWTLETWLKWEMDSTPCTSNNILLAAVSRSHVFACCGNLFSVIFHLISGPASYVFLFRFCFIYFACCA